jgi:hypothetical protein
MPIGAIDSMLCQAEYFSMSYNPEDCHLLNYRKLKQDGCAVFETDSVNLIFALRGGCMVDVFDLDSSTPVAYLDFDIKRNVMLGYAFGSPIIGLPFSNQFRKTFGKTIFPFRDLRPGHDVGFFVEKTYRNKGEKGLWNLDEVMLTIALETAFEEGVEVFIIKPTGDRTRYYRSKFWAQIRPTTGNDVILGIDVPQVRKKLKHIELQEVDGKTHFFRVTGHPDTR